MQSLLKRQKKKLKLKLDKCIGIFERVIYMAQVVVDSTVMRDKAKAIQTEAKKIKELYADMLQDVTTTANKMKGETIETEKNAFKKMEAVFDSLQKDIEAYSTFLTNAAEHYEKIENESTNRATSL